MSVHKTDRDQLVEEAAKAMHREVYSGAPTWPDTGKHIREQWLTVARAALAVFEKAHAPSDDEREVLIREIATEAANSVGGYARPGSATYDAATRAASAALRRTVQGEPSAEEVEAAHQAWSDYWDRDEGGENRPAIRAGLIAAAAVREEGQGR